jgi:hypothetical protein
VVEKYTLCTDEEGKQYMGERVTCFNRDIQIDERSARTGYYQMEGTCIKCGKHLDMLFADFVDGVYSGTQKTDQNQKWAYENRSYCYPKPTKSHGYDEDNLFDENEVISIYLSMTDITTGTDSAESEDNVPEDDNSADITNAENDSEDLKTYVDDGNKNEYSGLIDNTIYMNKVRREIKNKLGQKYLLVWDHLIRLHQKGVPLKFNQIFIEKKDILDNDIFPIVREILRNFAPGKLNSEPILDRHRNGGLGIIDLTPYNAVRHIRGEIDKITPYFDPGNEWLNKYLVNEAISEKGRFFLQWSAEQHGYGL